MDVIYLKKRENSQDPDNAQYIAPAVSLNTRGGMPKLIPHPYGSETIVYSSFDEALSAIHRAGYDCEFQNHHYPAPRHNRPAAITRSAPSGRSGKDNPLRQLMDSAQAHLEERLSDPSAPVIASAAYALGEMRAISSLDGLMKCLAHDDQHVRKNAGEAIAKLGRAGHQAFIKALRDPNWVVRHSAVTGLSELMHSDTGAFIDIMPHLSPLIKDDSWLVRSQVANLYGEVARFLRALEDSTPSRG